MERKNIYRERMSIEDFDVDDNSTINHAIFDILFQIDCISTEEKSMVSLFNDAYYVCTALLLEKRPYFQINNYSDILLNRNSIFMYPSVRVTTIMSIVAVYLKTLDIITVDIDKTINVLETKFEGCDDDIYKRITAVVDYKDWRTTATTFTPLNSPIDEEYGNFWKTYKDFSRELTEIFRSTFGDIQSKTEKSIFTKQDHRDIVTSGAHPLDNSLKTVNQELKPPVKESREEESREELESLRNDIEAYHNQGKGFTSSEAAVFLTALCHQHKQIPQNGRQNLAPLMTKIWGFTDATSRAALRSKITQERADKVAKHIKSWAPAIAAIITKLPPLLEQENTERLRAQNPKKKSC